MLALAAPRYAPAAIPRGGAMPVHLRYPNFLPDQRQFFDELITEDWDAYQSADWDAVRRFEVARLFQLVRPRRVLDVGCGCGFHDVAMASYPFVDLVHGIDYSPNSIARANDVYPHVKVSRTVADFASWIPPERYGLVASFHVIEHLEKPDELMAFCRDACADDGHVAVFTPNRARLRNVLRRLRGQAALLCDPQHFREYSRHEIERLGSRHGLVSVGAFGYGMTGVGWLDRATVGRRLATGHRLSRLADALCVVMRRR